jgi:hypothetical protein
VYLICIVGEPGRYVFEALIAHHLRFLCSFVFRRGISAAVGIASI